jgi:ABC-2 type transport system ATP-binding protein
VRNSPGTIGIAIKDACVDFPIFDARSRSLKRTVLAAAGGIIVGDRGIPIVEALRDITLHVERGARVGLVGHNGAGKSTLLRVMAGIYEPTRGTAEIHGRVAPVFDLGVGMDPETSGRDNIVTRGLFLGMTRAQMLARIDGIAEFTELGAYLRLPLRTYSTGMRMRLALVVVTSLDPEILLLDEGIGAVDAPFLAKSMKRVRDLVDRAEVLVLASRDGTLLRQLCDSAIWLDRGRIRGQGESSEVLAAYERSEA